MILPAFTEEKYELALTDISRILRVAAAGTAENPIDLCDSDIEDAGMMDYDWTLEGPELNNLDDYTYPDVDSDDFIQLTDTGSIRSVFNDPVSVIDLTIDEQDSIEFDIDNQELQTSIRMSEINEAMMLEFPDQMGILDDLDYSDSESDYSDSD
jgi:hypothetical protein